MQQFSSGGFNSIPLVVKNLLIINILFFLASYAIGSSTSINLGRYLALHYPGSFNFGVWQFVTYMFMHGGIWHIAFNMYALVLFGKVIESVWGPKRFLNYYLVTGIGSGLIHIFVTYLRIQTILPDLTEEQIEAVYTMNNNVHVTDSMMQLFELINTPTVGASGAIFGLLLAFGMMFPEAQLMLIFPPIPIKGKYIAIIALVLGVVLDFQGNVAHFAHLGGMVFGYFMILYWKKKGTLFH